MRRRFGGGLLTDLTPRHVKIIRDTMKATFTASTADIALGLLSTLWDYADEHLDLELGANPAHGIRRIHKVMNEHQPWPKELIEKFCAVVPPELRLALKLLLFTGQRRSDVVKMKWSQFDGAEIEVIQQKTREALTIPCHRELRAALSATPRRSEFILLGERGARYSPEGLSMAFRRALRRLGARGYSVHGIRKNAGVALADAGCGIREVMAILGHRTHAMALHYTRKADQRREARSAIEKWESVDSGKPMNKERLKR
jgi:integrase